MAELITTKALATFFLSGRSVRYGKSEVVVVGDDSEPEVFYIGKGYIKVYSINDEGEEYIHVIYKKGEIFPLIWALRDLKRHVFYESIGSSVLWKMPKEDFLAYIKLHTNDVTFALLEQMAEQFGIYADRLDNLEYRSAYERVVFRLLFLAGRFGKKDGTKIIIDVPLTHKVIAQSVNLARESVSRELELLTEKKLISHVEGKIIINNVKKLSHEFSEPVSLDLWGLQ
jgi:CRP-like cAMP-binding protein